MCSEGELLSLQLSLHDAHLKLCIEVRMHSEVPEVCTLFRKDQPVLKETVHVRNVRCWRVSYHRARLKLDFTDLSELCSVTCLQLFSLQQRHKLN